MLIERGNMSRHSEKESGKFMCMFLCVLGGAAVLFLLLWLMIRVNYKLELIRENTLPFFLKFLGGSLFLTGLFLLFIWIMNIYGRHLEKKQKLDKK